MSSPPENDALFKRLASLVRRELGAADVRLLPTGEAPPDAVNVLTTTLPDGRVVAVTFADAENLASHERRLDILVRAFVESLEESAAGKKVRPPPASSLREELRALAARAQAIDALVLDARSPVVWGAGRTRVGPTSMPDDPSAPKLVEVGAALAESPPPPLVSSFDVSSRDDEDDELADASRAIVERAIREVRALPEVDRARKGRPFRHVERTNDYGYVVHAFAGIYLLALVFSELFDEVRAERSIAEALPRVERLVMVLPPLDPTPGPTANVIAFKRPRRR